MVTCSSPSASNLSNRGLTPQDNLRGDERLQALIPLFKFLLLFLLQRPACGWVEHNRGNRPKTEQNTAIGLLFSACPSQPPYAGRRASRCGPVGPHVRASGLPYAGQHHFPEMKTKKNRIPFLSKGDPASMIRLYVVDNLQSRKASYQMLCTITLECKTTSTPI